MVVMISCTKNTTPTIRHDLLYTRIQSSALQISDMKPYHWETHEAPNFMEIDAVICAEYYCETIRMSSTEYGVVASSRNSIYVLFVNL